MIEIDKTWTGWIERQLARRHWNVSDLSKRLGCSSCAAYKWKKQKPNQVAFMAICMVFGYDYEEAMSLYELLE